MVVVVIGPGVLTRRPGVVATITIVFASAIRLDTFTVGLAFLADR